MQEPILCPGITFLPKWIFGERILDLSNCGYAFVVLNLHLPFYRVALLELEKDGYAFRYGGCAIEVLDLRLMVY